MQCNCDLPEGTPHDCSEERQADGAIEFMDASDMDCLCGHFEWCERCTPKPDDPEVFRKMTAADWARSWTVELPEDPMVKKWPRLFGWVPVLLLGCASQAYKPTESQLICYAQADSVATERVNDECGGHLTGCTAAKDIDSQLKAALAVCK